MVSAGMPSFPFRVLAYGRAVGHLVGCPRDSGLQAGDRLNRGGGVGSVEAINEPTRSCTNAGRSPARRDSFTHAPGLSLGGPRRLSFGRAGGIFSTDRSGAGRTEQDANKPEQG